jgi:hypothetical protein
MPDNQKTGGSISCRPSGAVRETQFRAKVFLFASFSFFKKKKNDCPLEPV